MPILSGVLAFEQPDDDGHGVVQIDSFLIMSTCGSPVIDGRSLPARLSKFPMLKKLRILEISSNIDDEESASARDQQHQVLEGLDDLEELVSLSVSSLPKAQRLPSLSKLSKLKDLFLEYLPGLQQIVRLGELKSLKSLKVSGCISLERLAIADLPYSTMDSIDLDLRGCKNFIDVDSDLSPLTEEGGANLGELQVTIRWPDESLGAIMHQTKPGRSKFENDRVALGFGR